MIYFDNAATSFPKPRRVAEEQLKCMQFYGGNPGRGSHALALAAEYGAAVLLVKADGTLTANAAMAAIFTPAGGREVAVP